MNEFLAPNGKPSNLTPEQYKLVRTPAFISWFGNWEKEPNDNMLIDENGEPMIWWHTGGDWTKLNNDGINGKGKLMFSPTKKSMAYSRDGEQMITRPFFIKSDFIYMLPYEDRDITSAYRWNKNKKNPIWFVNAYGGFVVIRQSNQIKLADGTNTTFDGGNPDIRFDGGGWIEKPAKIKEDVYKFQDKNGIGYIVKRYIGANPNKKWIVSNSIDGEYDGSHNPFSTKKEAINYIESFFGKEEYKTGGEIKDLVVLHNINDYQIEEANKIGGLITPSIAILKAGQSFTDFGSITLIGTKELIDPENRSVKVFAGDVYSPSVPRKLWYVDKRTLEKATTELIKKSIYYDDNISKSNREIYHLVNQYIGNSSDFDRDIEKNSFNILIEQYFEKLKLIYIVDKSIKIKVPFKDKRHFLWNNAEFKLTEEQKKRFAPILTEYTNESNETGSNGTSEEIRSKVYDLFLEVLNNIKLELKEEYKNKEDGDKLYEIISNKMFESFEKNVGTRYDWSGYTEYNLSRAVWSEKELDKEKLNQTIKKVFTKDVIEDYKEWLSDFISQFQGSAYFLKGNEKMPYTLNYLVDATSNRVVGQEKNMTFGVNQAKSFGTKRLNSISEIKKNSNNLISKEEMNLIDKKNSDNFFSLSQSLKYEDENTWRKLDSLGKALADYFKGTSIVSALRKNDFKTPSSYQITLFEDFAYELKNSPVDYFEAKYQRAVSLSEFKYAVIPFNTDTKTIDILRSNKLIVKKYKTDDDRFQIVNNISEKDKSIKFDNGGSVLLAPNGKPSNLTPEQYKLVREPAFKKWFGDWEKDPKNASKVVDENGEPLVVFHFTEKKFNVFELRGLSNGFFFTENKKDEEFSYTKKTKPYFLNIKKMSELSEMSFEQWSVPYYENEWIKKSKDGGSDGIQFIRENIDFHNKISKNKRIIVAFESNQIKLADGTNTTFDGNNPDIRFKKGGDVNFNVDRYREVEKEMFELSTQGKTDSLEYFKLIKERSILEKNKSKENMNNNSTETFAKGGKILVKEIKDANGGIKKVHNDFEKFGRIDVQDKYFIEASNDVGLQNVVFNKESLLAKITASFNNLLEKYTDFVINKDSKSITAYIENEIKTLEREGASLDVIEREKEKINNQSERDNVIKQIAQTQLDSLKQWVLYLSESDYPIAFRYLMLKTVMGYNYDLKLNKLFDRTDETIRNITPFDAGSLAELYTLNSNYLLQDYVQLMNDNSKRVLDSKEIIDENANGKWIKFNGGSGTSSEDIEKNGKDLMKLVQNTYWCTKSLATSQLMGGDFYVYVSEIDNEVLPQIAIRMDGNKVGEVRGNVSNAQDLSAEMLPIAKKFLLKNIPNDSGKRWLDSIQYNERCVMMRKRLETEGLYKDFIYEYIELLSQKNKYRVDYGFYNGNVTLMIEKFNEAKENLPNEFYQRGDIEFDANFLSPLTKYFIGSLKRNNLSNLIQQNIDISDLSRWNLKLVSENLDCSNIITNLGNVEFIGEDLTLTSSVLNFGNVKYVGGRFDMGFAQIDSLGSIETIGGGLIVNSSLKNLGNLKKIGYLDIESCDEQFTLGKLEEIDGNFTINVKDKNIDFGNLKSVGGNFDANKTIVTDLKGLESVGGSFNIAGSKIKIFPNLKTIGGDADFSNNFCSSTQDIEYILGNVKFLNSRIMEFPKLTKVGGEIDFRGSMFKTFGSIKSIGGNVKLNESKIEELGDLEEINGYASFEGTKVTTLNKLKKIVKFANFQGSNLEDLGDLESIGGNAYFNKTNIKSIGKLKYIGGFAQFDGNQELEKQWQKVQNAE